MPVFFTKIRTHLPNLQTSPPPAPFQKRWLTRWGKGWKNRMMGVNKVGKEC